MKTFRISILTDKSSWMNKYNKELSNQLSKLGHNVEIIHSKNDLKTADIAFFLGCFEMIPEEFLKLNKHNIVVHESNLPKGKGWSPLTWQVLDGKDNIPICLFEADKKCDSGKIYLKDEIVLSGNELVDELRAKQGKKTIEMCLEFIKNYSKIKGTEQSGEESFYQKRTPKDSEININKTIDEQFNLLRVVDNENYPAFFIKDGIKYELRIKKCQKP